MCINLTKLTHYNHTYTQAFACVIDVCHCMWDRLQSEISKWSETLTPYTLASLIDICSMFITFCSCNLLLEIYKHSNTHSLTYPLVHSMREMAVGQQLRMIDTYVFVWVSVFEERKKSYDWYTYYTYIVTSTVAILTEIESRIYVETTEKTARLASEMMVFSLNCLCCWRALCVGDFCCYFIRVWTTTYVTWCININTICTLIDYQLSRLIHYYSLDWFFFLSLSLLFCKYIRVVASKCLKSTVLWFFFSFKFFFLRNG